MTAQVIDGRACARQLEEQLVGEVAAARADGVGIGLATLAVGDEYSAGAYERRLRRLAGELGVPYLHRALPATATEAEVLAEVELLDADPAVSGSSCCARCRRASTRRGCSARSTRSRTSSACTRRTPGCWRSACRGSCPRPPPRCSTCSTHWLDSVGEDRADFYHRSNIVVVGRSNNVGKPAISLGYERQATVQSVDEWADRTTGIGRHTRWADVLVVAAGVPGLIRAEHVSEGAVVSTSASTRRGTGRPGAHGR